MNRFTFDGTAAAVCGGTTDDAPADPLKTGRGKLRRRNSENTRGIPLPRIAIGACCGLSPVIPVSQIAEINLAEEN